MDMVQLYFEKVLNERNVKVSSVIGDNDLESFNVPHKVIKVLSVDIGMNPLTVIKGDRCDLITPVF